MKNDYRIRPFILTVMTLAALLGGARAHAVSGVNPTGVNVRTSGPSTAFLTFQNLDPNERAVEAFWCGQVVGATGGSVSATNPCVAGTIFGRLPLRHDLSRTSSAGAFINLTDIMTIPASVARRALQDAQSGAASDFFYVRRFSGGAAGDRYVVVTCRMAGAAGARSPLALLDVRVAFGTERGDAPVLFLARGTTAPRFSAKVAYNGSGALKGRWEVVLPGDIEPSVEDLLTEATLPIERRALQRRYTQLARFEIFLPPGGPATIPGPDPARVPVEADGPYKILLRIEASGDKEGDSNTLGGVVMSGGVAGFPMPVLRYYVGTSETLEALRREPTGEITLMLPLADSRARAAALNFSWVDIAQAALYRLEIDADGTTVLTAIVAPGVSSYTAPPWLAQPAAKPLRWRVIALDADGETLARSRWRTLQLE
ncbi:MAG TPA: hypothetical protein VI565_11380 [Burkholderiales bacterium]|nr:hypothetical protein [Burkholderiales bacterium]